MNNSGPTSEEYETLKTKLAPWKSIMMDRLKSGRITMRSLIVIAMVTVFCLVGSAKAQKPTDKAANIFVLGAKGIMTVRESPSGDGSRNYLILEVSPSWWKKQTKATKQSVVNQGIMLAKAGKRGVIHGVYVANRANRKWLAYGDPSTGAIEIYKKEGSYLKLD